jgi:DNA-binding CsgD family transcriptional regulator
MTNDQPELTSKEARVAMCVAEGKTCPEISRLLKLSNESVRSLMKRLREKTGYRRKPSLAIWANLHQGWLKIQAKKPANRRTRRKVAMGRLKIQAKKPANRRTRRKVAMGWLKIQAKKPANRRTRRKVAMQ